MQKIKENPKNLMKTGDPIAVILMRQIAFDNNFFDRWNPEKYDRKWIELIQPKALAFFGANPDYMTDEHIDEICCGEVEENRIAYGHLTGYSELNDALNKYFNEHD